MVLPKKFHLRDEEKERILSMKDGKKEDDFASELVERILRKKDEKKDEDISEIQEEERILRNEDGKKKEDFESELEERILRNEDPYFLFKYPPFLGRTMYPDYLERLEVQSKVKTKHLLPMELPEEHQLPGTTVSFIYLHICSI